MEKLPLPRNAIIEVTQACQYACAHCYNYWREKRAPVKSTSALSRREIQDVVRRIKSEAPLQHVGLSGGEPLLRGDTPEITADLMDEELGVVVITNGAKLTAELVGRFPKETVFSLTLFSADATLHDRIAGRNGAFEKVLEAALHASQRGCHVVVSMVVNALNAHDVRRTLELGIAIGANLLQLNRTNLSRVTLPRASELIPTAKQLAAALEAANTVAVDYEASVGVAVPIPPCVVDPSPYTAISFGWCPRGGEASYYTVSFDGLLRPCNHSSFVIGDVRKESFAALVRSRRVQQYWSPIPEVCRRCTHPLGDSCRGGCPAASYECYGAADRWDPFVEASRTISTEAKS